MYKQWLYFFNSSLTEVSVKNSKEKQKVKKEWLDNGGVKISGDKPKKWSIELQPIISVDIYTLQYDIKQQKLEAKSLFKRAFKYKNKELFKEAEQLYLSLEKKQKDIDTIINNNDKLKLNIKEKIFQIRRNLFLENSKKPVDYVKIKKLIEELEKATLEQISINKRIKETENNYILKTQSIIQEGPIPEPPVVKYLSMKIGRSKKQFELNIEKEEENAELENNNDNNDNNDSDDDNSDNDNEISNQNGGTIKVIKLK